MPGKLNLDVFVALGFAGKTGLGASRAGSVASRHW